MINDVKNVKNEQTGSIDAIKRDFFIIRRIAMFKISKESRLKNTLQGLSPRHNDKAIGSMLVYASFVFLPHISEAQGINQTLETITITGSSIKRNINDQQALPVTIYSVEELRSSGVSSTEEIVQRITSSQSSMGISQSVGSTTGGRSNANLRGLGSNKTLVLLDGRRLAFFGIGSDSIDLNSIPFAALERVEVLRDGASAVYGTDAVGGVINFITKRKASCDVHRVYC
jgi:iron complex outermembrane receptor protein